MVSTIGMMFGILALAMCAGFLAGIYDLWTQQEWTRLVLITSAVTSIIVIVPWTNEWPRSSVFWALLFDAVVLVAVLPAWGERFAEEGEPL